MFTKQLLLWLANDKNGEKNNEHGNDCYCDDEDCDFVDLNLIWTDHLNTKIFARNC